MALSHCCCRTTVQQISQFVSSRNIANSSCCSQSQCALRRQGTTTGTKLTSIPVGRQREKQRSGRVVVVHSMHVQQPLGTNDRPNECRPIFCGLCAEWTQLVQSSCYSYQQWLDFNGLWWRIALIRNMKCVRKLVVPQVRCVYSQRGVTKYLTYLILLRLQLTECTSVRGRE